MARLADTVAEYTRVFKQAPSSMTMETLRALEYELQLTEGDPQVLFFIFHLRQVDLTAMINQKRSADEKTHRDALGELLPRVERLAGVFDDGINSQKRRLAARTAREAEYDDTHIAVEIYRRSLPLLSYITEAFQWRNGVDDRDQRIVAARIDVMLLAAVSAVLFMIGVASAHFI